MTVLVQCAGAPEDLAEAGLLVKLVTGPIAIGAIQLGRLAELAARDDVTGVAADRQGRPELNDSVPDIKANLTHAAPLSLTGQGVVVGIVDNGVDAFHRNFRRANGTTRILSLLDTTYPRTTISVTGGPPGAGAEFALFWTAPAWALPTPLPPGGLVTTVRHIPATATADDVKTAITGPAGFTGLTPADVAASGGPLPGTPVVIELVGRYQGKSVAPMEISSWSFDAPSQPATESGRKYTPAEIEAALATPDQPFFGAESDTHGTHVAGIAAGDGSQAGNCRGMDVFVGVAPAADLVVVKTQIFTSQVIQGAKHVFDFAAGLTPRKPAVVNLSLHTGDFARDGTDYVDVSLDALLVDTAGNPIPGRAIVCGAGNDGKRIDPLSPSLSPQERGGGVHCRKQLTGAAPSVTLELHIAPDDHTRDEVVFWYGQPPAAAGGPIDPASVNVQIAEPGGTSLPVVAPGSAVPTPVPTLAGSPVRIESVRDAPQNHRHYISVFIEPSPTTGAIASGPWRLTFTETTGNPATLDGLILFSASDPHPRFAFVDQISATTLSAPGTGKNVISVGAYNASDSTLAATSSRGPTMDGRHKPDLSAPGVGIVAPKAGVPTTGCCKGEGCCCACCTDFYVPLDGTSMAAPHVTGVVALMLQRNGTRTFRQIRDTLVATVRPPGGGPAEPTPADSWGAGRVDAQAACQATPVARAGHLRALPDPAPLLLPVPAYPAAFLPARERLGAIQTRLPGTPAAQLAAALVSAHVDEVLRLLEHDRRTVLAWHRMHGPELVRLLVYDEGATQRPLPAMLGGRPLAAGLAQLLDALERAGSPALRADVARYRWLVLQLPGVRLDDLPLTG